MDRDRIGNVSIDWKLVAFGIGKYRRKTFGFGTYDSHSRRWSEELYVRELSIIDGGIGCAVWDAAIILSRWIRENSDLFSGKSVIELGSGIGLCGIMASRFAKNVYLTDFIDPLLKNIEYNISLNSTIDEDNSLNRGNEVELEKERKWRSCIGQNSSVVCLDWKEVGTEKETNIPLADIIIGSELTYTGDKEVICALIRCVSRYLSPDGLFIEILSDDRDGVEFFVEKATESGFIVRKEKIPDELLGNYGTGQRDETYHMYFCHSSN